MMRLETSDCINCRRISVDLFFPSPEVRVSRRLGSSQGTPDEQGADIRGLRLTVFTGSFLNAWTKQGEAYLTELTEPFFGDQSIEILCARCHRTSPRTIAWICENDRYRCPGCDTEVVIERETLLRGVQLSRT